MENPASDCALYTLAGFFSGSVMFSYLIPKIFRNIDVRNAAPDRNPGGINAVRAAGSGIGLLCILLDILKGFIPVYAAVAFAQIRGFWLIPVTAAPVAGHAFSPFLGFRGGKAVSTAFGVLLGIFSISRIAFLLAFFTILFKFITVVRPDSSCVTASFSAAFLASLFLEPDKFVKIAFFLVGTTVLCKLKHNPDAGKHNVSVGRYTVSIEKKKVRLHKQ